MAVVFSGGALVTLKQAGAFPLRAVPSMAQGVPLTLAYAAGDHATYARMYSAQDSVRSIVGFLARSAARVRLHAFKRVDDTDRQRLSTHPAVKLLDKPMPGLTWFDLSERIAVEYLIFGESFLLKVRQGGRLTALVPVSPARMVVEGSEAPLSFNYTATTGEQVEGLLPSDVIYLREFNPDSPLRGLSRLESLRQVLNAEAAAVRGRAAFFSRGSRLGAAIEIPPETELTAEQRQSFSREFAAQFSGADKTGRVALLEPGFKIHELAMASAKDSEYVESRKLSKQEVMDAYGLIAGLVTSPSDVAREVLAPYFRKLEQLFTQTLLSEYGDTDNVYLEANLDELMHGDTVATMQAYRVAAGKPFMTVNEIRARMNLGRSKDKSSNELPTPLYLGSEATSGGGSGRKPGNVEDGQENRNE